MVEVVAVVLLVGVVVVLVVGVWEGLVVVMVVWKSECKYRGRFLSRLSQTGSKPTKIFEDAPDWAGAGSTHFIFS